MGYCPNGEIVPASGDTRVAWWAGNGGSMSYVDLDARMSLGYVPNRWIGGKYETDRARNLIRAAYQSLAAPAGVDREVSRVA